MTIKTGSSSGTGKHKNFNTPTENQIAALERYAESPWLPAPLRDGIKHYLANNKFTFAIASDTIGMIKAFLSAEEKAKKVEEGIYVNPDSRRYYKVQAARGSGRLYAQELRISADGVKNPDGSWEHRPQFEWVYLAGLIRQIQPEWRITKEEAKEFGDCYSTCIRCTLELTKPESIKRGMGDVCASKI